MLRELGCRLPIQIWHLGSAELDQTMAALVRPFGVECVDALEVRRQHPVRTLNGWELKPYAILHCPFREVLLLDATICLLSIPSFSSRHQSSPVQALCSGRIWARSLRHRRSGASCRIKHQEGPEFESGQIVVDKQRCWAPRSLAMWYNEHSDFFIATYTAIKILQLAFRKLHVPWSMTKFPSYRCHNIIMQHDFAGRCIFQHQQKWSLFGNSPM